MIDVVDIHAHSVASGHAYNSIYEMAKSAADKGIKLFGISDHGPALEGASTGIYFRAGDKLPKKIYGMDFLFGCELNIMDFEGNVDLVGEDAKNIRYGIASLHDICIKPGTRIQNTNAYVKSMKNPKVCIIGHPDDGTYDVDMDLLAKAAGDNGVLIELNECSVMPNTFRHNSIANAYRMLESCMKYNTRIIVSSDAHVECSVGVHTYAVKMLEEIGFPEKLVVNKSVDETLEALRLKGV